MQNYKEMVPTTKGTMGVGLAIGYFCSIGCVVSIPINDNQKYDLLVEIDGVIKRVQVKSTGFKKRNKYVVELRTICPKKLSTNHITRFDKTKIDILVIVTEEKTMYVIPTENFIAKSGITLSEKYDEYKV